MKIMKWKPIALTAIHGGFSLFLLAVSHLMPLGGVGGGIGYCTALLAFMINLPGIHTLKQFYTTSPSDGPLSMLIGSIGMIAITDIYLFLFLSLAFYGIGKLMKSANNRVEDTGDPLRGSSSPHT